jgi:hypothetical protein
MGLSELAASVLPVQGIVSIGIGYISDVVNRFAPDVITPEQKATLQKVVGMIYCTAKNFGPELVARTDTDLDDKGLAEAFEVCELAATKYELELNPENL